MTRKPSSREDIVEKYKPVVKMVVQKALSNYRPALRYIDAADLEQSAWVTLLECLPKCDESKGPSGGYIFVSIRRTVYREIRKALSRAMLTGVVPEIACMDTDDIIAAQSDLLVDMIENKNLLTSVERKVFWARYTEGHTFENIGQMISASRETARKHFLNAIEKLKEFSQDGKEKET